MAVRYPNLTTKGAGPNGTGVYLEIGLLHIQRDLRSIADTLNNNNDDTQQRLVYLADTVHRALRPSEALLPQSGGADSAHQERRRPVSNDLINDLRGNFDAYPEILAAADEIERLRAALRPLLSATALDGLDDWRDDDEMMPVVLSMGQLRAIKEAANDQRDRHE